MSTRITTPTAEDLAPVLADTAASYRVAAVTDVDEPRDLEPDLQAGAALLVFVEGAPDDARLAAWRNALWPRLHVVALYRCGEGRARRQTLQGTQPLEGATPLVGVVLLAHRRTEVMAPEATVEKFDHNAAGWDGTPGGPGYPHFRWMRKYVGLFAGAARGSRILDFGCGAGWVGIEAAKAMGASELCFFDPSPEMVRIAEGNAAREGIAKYEGRTGFGEDPPFPRAGEEPFDLVLSSGVVSFSPDVERWLDGLARAVKPEGTLVVGDIHLDSKGFRKRRRTKPLLPVREMNAQLPEHIRAGLEARGFTFKRMRGYQLTWPVPQAMHLNETKFKGVLTLPLLMANRAAAAVVRAQSLFDSWVMELVKRRE
ncbi:MAG: class I SAM-dependent methyltransferase [bacterium]|nr:class I SAM-dependent methyltransferase [bacterium]